MACGILVPQRGIEPGATAVKAPSPNHWTGREVPHFLNLEMEKGSTVSIEAMAT